MMRLDLGEGGGGRGWYHGWALRGVGMVALLGRRIFVDSMIRAGFGIEVVVILVRSGSRLDGFEGRRW